MKPPPSRSGMTIEHRLYPRSRNPSITRPKCPASEWRSTGGSHEPSRTTGVTDMPSEPSLLQPSDVASNPVSHLLSRMAHVSEFLNLDLVMVEIGRELIGMLSNERLGS